MSTTTLNAPTLPTLKPTQQLACDFMVDNPFCGIWLDIGVGKTLTTLTALTKIRPAGHILVIAPVSIARSTWIDEIEKWQLPFRTRSLIVNDNDKKLTRAKRLERYASVFSSPATMWFINQDLIVDLVENMPRQKINGHDTVMWPFQTVIIDEAQAFKSHTSQRFKALKLVRPAISRLIELTGTPATNGLHDLWAQMYLLDQGAALGPTIGAFRDRWFTPQMIPGVNAPAKWIPHATAESEIHAAISGLVMSARSEPAPLPDPIIDDVLVQMPANLIEIYKKLKRDLVLTFLNEAVYDRARQAFHHWLTTSADADAQTLRSRLPDPADTNFQAVYQQLLEANIARFATDPDDALINSVIAQNQAVLQSKLMQFAGGTLYTSDPDVPSTSGRYEVLHTAKIDITKQIIEAHPSESILLAYHFTSDKHEILSALQKAGIHVETFDGSRQMVSRWNRRQIRVMLVHPASAGPGLNLQDGGRRLIWFTVPFSLQSYQQLNGRLQRSGQTQQVYIHRLLTEHTLDQRMPAVLLHKSIIQERLINSADISQAMLQTLADEVQEDLNDLWLSERL